MNAPYCLFNYTSPCTCACVNELRTYTLHTIVFSSLVPPPSISISADGLGMPLYQGTARNLTCSHAVDPSVDTSYTADVTFSGPSGNEADQTGRFIFFPINTTDTGRYTCIVSITSEDQFVNDVSHSTTRIFTVEGV